MQIFKTIIGNSAEGEFYFHRPYLDLRLWKRIQSDGHLLISAPRRIGKTSFLLNICNQEKQGHLVKYHITESINGSNEFFKRLYKSLLEELSKRQNIWQGLTETLKRNNIEKIGINSIELKRADLDYFEEFKRLIYKLQIDERLVFIVDEFSETTENIIRDHGANAGQSFLHQNRELRQDKSISRKIQFIYSGSIGLGNIAERIGAVKSINDLTDFPIPPLSKEETLAMIKQLTIAPDLVFDERVKQHLINRIHWLIPYYLQIILDEVETILLQSGNSLVVSAEMIDHAIDQALRIRNYFEHWHARLRTTLKGKNYTFAKEVLNVTSQAEVGISKTEIFDLAAKHDMGDDYNLILRTLEYDGYINPNGQKLFLFNSPLLKIWWERNIAI